MFGDNDKIEIENPGSLGRLQRADRATYLAIKEIILQVRKYTGPFLKAVWV